MNVSFLTLLRWAGVAMVSAFLVCGGALGEGTNAGPFTIDLPTALRLAGAQSLDVQIARERLLEAKAQQDQAMLRFFPWLAPGAGYRRHDGNIQDVAGAIFEANKQAYTVGAALTLQVDLGDAIYQSLASRQMTRAAEESVEISRQDEILAAAIGYLELAKTEASIAVLQDGLKIAEDYASQVHRAMEVGVAYKGEVLRADLQTRKNQLQIRRATEDRRLAAARLAQLLRLDPAVDLLPAPGDLAPLTLVATNAALDTLVAQALGGRPELRRASALVRSAEAGRDGAVKGPWIPTVGAMAYLGGLGGGMNSAWNNFDGTADYLLGATWRIGPGGIGDRSRVRGAKAREQISLLETQKVSDEVIRQVVSSLNRAQSLADQLEIARQTVETAAELLRLSRDRKEFNVGAVLEAVQAEADLTQARLEYLTLLASHNQAQFALRRATGGDTSVAGLR